MQTEQQHNAVRETKHCGLIGVLWPSAPGLDGRNTKIQEKHSRLTRQPFEGALDFDENDEMNGPWVAYRAV